MIGKVLVVEDNAIAQQAIKMMLKQMGCQVELASTGEEALNLTKDHHDLYKLIFMDIGLPDINGIEVTEKIRASENGKTHIPIIALTALSSNEDKQKCMKSGMDNFLAKPVSKEDLEKILRTYHLL